jgi:hypothetical protein
MAKPTIVPVGFQNDYTDFLNIKCDRSGAVRLASGSVVVPNATAVGAFIGLIPFDKGARFLIKGQSVYITDIDSGTDSLLNLGVIYDSAEEGTDVVDLFATGSTVGRTAGFIVPNNPAGLTYVTTGKGWLAVENDANVTEAEGTISFLFGVAYDQPSL